MLSQQSPASNVTVLTASIPSPSARMANAIAAYQRLAAEETSGLQRQITSLLLSLTGQEAAAGCIWADGGGRMAVAKLDGHTFCLRGEELTLLRSCAYCGVQSFNSPSIRTVEDLGRALSWEPRCKGCEPDDEDWSYSW
ncbi:MAG: hypothetical protein M3Q29_22640 [Chloroflexota bacterium]|nr:hypothetical protein [Chloroflexota bacterium]